MVNLPILQFVKQVLFTIVKVSLIAYIIPFFLIYEFQEGIFRFLLIAFVGFISATSVIFGLGLSIAERKYAIRTMQESLAKIRR
jgi:hypothetical protein